MGPAVMTFEDNDVTSIVRIGIDEDMQKVMNKYAIGSMVKVKTRIGFLLGDRVLTLTSEKVDLMTGVRIVVE